MKKTAITLFFLLQAACLFSQIPRPEYPRPQLRRESFFNLNGVWDYSLTPSGDEPEVWDGVTA